MDEGMLHPPRVGRFMLTIQRFGLKTWSNADNRDVKEDFLTLLHTHRVDFHTSFRHLSVFPTSSSSGEAIQSFLKKMLRASLPNPSDEKISDAIKDFTPYFQRFAERISRQDEVEAWTTTTPALIHRGIELHEGAEWQEKREVEMLRHNPKFVLRQWVLEELIAKLEETGVERIEEGRRELARVLDVSLLILP